VKYSQYESAVVEQLEDDQVISVCANPYRVAYGQAGMIQTRCQEVSPTAIGIEAGVDSVGDGSAQS
jgi:hypothetical protein